MIAPHSTCFSTCCFSPSNNACALPIYKSVLEGWPAAFSWAMRTIKACISGPGVNWPFRFRPYFLFMPARNSLKPSPPPKVFCDHCARKTPSFFAPSIICVSVALAAYTAVDQHRSKTRPSDANRMGFSCADIHASFRCRDSVGNLCDGAGECNARLHRRAGAGKSIGNAPPAPSTFQKYHAVGGMDVQRQRAVAVESEGAAFCGKDAIGDGERQKRLVA